MIRKYTEFKNKRVWKRVNVSWPDFQCVDLFRQYMTEVLGIPHKACGNAIDIWKNTLKPFDKTWSKFEGTKDLMQGDVICATNWRCGHIAIVDCAWPNMIFVLEQNGAGGGTWTGDSAIRVQWYKPKFRAWVRRCQKIFDNLQSEREYIKSKLAWSLTPEERKNTENYQQAIRYLVT